MNFVSNDYVLDCASRWGHTRIITFLLQNGATKLSCGLSWTSAWQRCIIDGYEEGIRLLIDHVDVDNGMWVRL